MSNQLSDRYFISINSLIVEVVLLIILPVAIFLYIPSLLPYRTIYIVLSFVYIFWFFRRTNLPIAHSLGITTVNLKSSVSAALVLTMISGLILVLILTVFPDIKEIGAA